jgi:hypothetical protein
MTARFDRAWAKASRANLAASVGFMRPLSASQSASARHFPYKVCQLRYNRCCIGRCNRYACLGVWGDA